MRLHIYDYCTTHLADAKRGKAIASLRDRFDDVPRSTLVKAYGEWREWYVL